jgi:GMP synthase (glutamine-hydrolysing)
MILIVDMNWKKDSLAYYEFVSPIVSVVKTMDNYEVKHFTEIEPEKLDFYDKIILSGTTLKDFATLKLIERFNWVKEYNKPIFGICAGIQTICLVFGVPLTNCLQIGMTDIETVESNPLFEGAFKAYALHSLSPQPSEDFSIIAKSKKCIEAVKHKRKEIYGVLFHPEVRNIEIIERFIGLHG